jgi:hypothetical protein
MKRLVPFLLFAILLLFCAATLDAQIELFARKAVATVPVIEPTGFGEMVAGVDLDGDGKLEIYAVNNNWNDAGAELIPRIYKFELNSTTGMYDSVWSSTLTIPLQNTWPTLTVADLDNDGKKEVIWGPVNNLDASTNPNPARVIVFEVKGDGSDILGVSDGSGGYKPNSTWTITDSTMYEIRPFRWFVSDVDFDGTPELVWADRGAPASPKKPFRFGIASVNNIPDAGTGGETWTLECSGKDSVTEASTVYDIAAVDSNIYVIHSNGSVTPIYARGGQYVWGPVQKSVVGTGGSWKSAQTVDLDGDGKKEIVTGGWASGSANNNVYLLQVNADTLVPTVIANLALGTGARIYGGAAGDIDADGKLDFVYGSRDAIPNALISRVQYTGGTITDPANYKVSSLDASYATGGRWDLTAICNDDADADGEVFYSNGIDGRIPVVRLDRQPLPWTNLMTVAEARKDSNADFQPDRNGQRVTVVGVVSSANFTASANRFSYYIQEGNAGINITRGSVTGGGPVYKVGDKLAVNGVVGYYRGSTQLALDSVGAAVYLGSGFTATPVDVTINNYLANGELYEGRLIRIQYVAKDASSIPWPGPGSDANMTIWDGWRSLLLRIDLDTDVDDSVEVIWPASITGVGTQYTSSSGVYNDGYQITPNSYSGFTQNVAAPPQRKLSWMSPASGSRVVLNDTSQIVPFLWRQGVDLNQDTLVYFWYAVGVGSPISTGNGGLDTMIDRTGKQMRDAYLTGGKDSSQIRWTVIMREKGKTTNYAALDTFSLMVVRGSITAVDESELVPETFSLAQNYPNPFNPATTINYGLATQATVKLIVYDILGREVVTLLNDVQPAGRHSIRWEGRTSSGQTVASGVYFYRLEARPVSGGNTFTDLKKMMMLK